MRNLVQGTVLGVVLAWILVINLGYTSAIAAPEGLFDALSFGDSPIPGLILWNLTVVYGLGVGLLVGATSYMLARLVPERAIVLAAVTCASVWLAGSFGYDIVQGRPIVNPFYRAWWQYSFEIILVLSMFLPIIAQEKWGKRIIG